MEDRLIDLAPRHRAGLAIGALLAIVTVTVAWWALALWPVAGAEPAWLERTRLACFGSPPGGLPDTAGWIVLIGQPLGMLAFLLAAWPTALREDLERWRHSPRWRPMLLALPLALVALAGLAVLRVMAVQRTGTPPVVEPAGTLRADSASLEGLTLVDQFGVRHHLTDLARRPTILTAAFGHCETVCPTLVHDILRARGAMAEAAPRLVIITMDPWRDTPERLATIAAAWQLPDSDLVLSGAVAEVEQALDRLRVSRSRDARTGDVAHAPVVFRLDQGRVVTRLDQGWGTVGELLRETGEGAGQ